ncbi:uncharacterized protein EI90DRAFT_2866120, partial [Cantharellus anzutake]|uniref:uncharacterized protein n=1 Tax=Cantharellus anzutake TaxID=1750568 RepID=UPI0019058B78
EQVVVDWMKHLSSLAQPLDRRAVLAYVKTICGHNPGKNWFHRFVHQHRHEIHYCRPSSLDTKRARAFNPTTVSNHQDQWEALLSKWEIPPENIWNYDEKGIQL